MTPSKKKKKQYFPIPYTSLLFFGDNWHPNLVGWMQDGRKCILTIFQEERFSVLQ